MSARRVPLLAAVLLSAPALQGCVAAAIPALAGAAIVRSERGGKVEVEAPLDPQASAVVQPAPAPATAPATTQATIPTLTSTDAGLTKEPQQSSPLSAASANIPANVIIGPAPAPKSVSGRPTDELAPGTPYFPFVSFAQKQALATAATDPPLSAMLRDPAALDGERSPCKSKLPLVLIDLDPKGGTLSPGPLPKADASFAKALQSLRERDISIAWISGNLPDSAQAIRSALTQSGLDPEAQDRLVLLRKRGDRKQTRRQDLAKGHCIIAIAGDSRADFDELFEYLVNPEAALGLELLIGEAWFLIPPVFEKDN